MGKFGCKENFDVYIYIEGREEPFVLDTVKHFLVEADNDTQSNTFAIQDSLINQDFANAVLGGMFANKFCKLVCTSTFRMLEGHDVTGTITVVGAVLQYYKFAGNTLEPTQPNLVFEADFFNKQLQPNTKIEIDS